MTAKTAQAQMSRLKRGAILYACDFSDLAPTKRAAAEAMRDFSALATVRLAFTELLKSNGPGVPVFLTDVLHGAHGSEVAAECWRAIVLKGVPITSGSPQPTSVSFSTHTMFAGNLDILREVVMRGPSVHIGAELRPANRSQLLDLLCTTEAHRLHPEFQGLDGFTGLVGVAAAYFNDCQFSNDALALAMEVDPQHAGFTDLAEEASEGGAFVREFLLKHGISTSEAASPVQVGAASVASVRSRRTL